jgi:hypothetical protein
VRAWSGSVENMERIVDARDQRCVQKEARCVGVYYSRAVA